MKKEIKVYDDLGNFIGLDEIESSGVTPQDAIKELNRKFDILSEQMDEEKDVIEFNELFFKWLDDKFDLRVERR
jgi:hypothetical protein